MTWYYYRRVERENKKLTEKYLRELNWLEKFGAISLMFILQHQVLDRGVELINDKGETKIIWEK